jgi:hypothetical protein
MDDSGNQLDFNFCADDLLEFPRDLGEEGWFQFHSEQKSAFQRVERTFGIRLNCRVRVRLREGGAVLEGRLVLDSLPTPSATTVRLRIGSVYFTNTDIKDCFLLD